MEEDLDWPQIFSLHRLDPNSPIHNGKSWLHLACTHRNKPLFNLLLQLKADPTLSDLNQELPIHAAATDPYFLLRILEIAPQLINA